MKKQAGFAFVLAAAFGLFATATPAFATPISQTISLGKVFAGSTPDGSAPWLTATFTQTGTNTGTLTLTSMLSGSDFLQGLNGKNKKKVTSTIGWAFFLDQSLSSFTCTGVCGNGNSGFQAGGFNTGPVPGTFNLAFGWGPGNTNRFDGPPDSATYTLTFAGDLTGNPFGTNDGGWMSVAHVQGIGPNASCSGWIVNGSVAPGTPNGTPCGGTHNVPEPGNLGILGLGTLLVGLFIGLRRRYS